MSRICPECKSTKLTKAGFAIRARERVQRWHCTKCHWGGTKVKWSGKNVEQPLNGDTEEINQSLPNNRLERE